MLDPFGDLIAEDMLQLDPQLPGTMSLGHCVTTGVPSVPISDKSEAKEASQVRIRCWRLCSSRPVWVRVSAQDRAIDSGAHVTCLPFEGSLIGCLLFTSDTGMRSS